MHKARSFFFICAGIFLLALAYHLGARSATAQSGLVEAGSIHATSGGGTCAVGRTFYNGVGNAVIPVPVPGSARIIATGYGNLGPTVMLENGDLYGYDQAPSVLAWRYLGNMLGAPTPATRATWGEVKAKYRPGAATQDK